MIAKVTIVGLGSGDEHDLSLAMFRRLQQADTVYVRTADHPITAWLQMEGISMQALDEVYEKHDDFASVYQEIADLLMKKANDEKAEVIYAVPGHPMVAEQSVQLLLQQGDQHGVQVEVVGGHSFLDAAFARLQFDPIEGFQMLDASHLESERIDPALHQIFCQVYDGLTASEVKLSLMEHMPDDTVVQVASSLGIEGEERILTVPLYELDRIDSWDNRTIIYVAPQRNEQVLYRRFDFLTAVIAHLRGPDGCPWDQEQTHESLRPYLLEEAYEFLEAIAEDDPEQMADELGDVLLQVLLHAQIGAEEGTFDIGDVIECLSAKMIRRHPHVFAEGEAKNADEVLYNWEQLKQAEKEGVEKKESSLLDGIPKTFPAIQRALKLHKRMAKVGFDWDSADEIRPKLLEELDELYEAEGEEEQEKEMGDLLFVVLAIAHHLGVDAEQALLSTCRKVTYRFAHIEQQAKEEDIDLSDASIAQMDQWWDEAKAQE
ncbi:nucleoside triphosphate pyrophosphohydrolase [Mechercharimyces sp. CAU 1602]|uniref:nucleoside triphosphate pyrophosphohydrolase n=1 Tax=Mechercharimyces sp. CAU 1602 TaxID=2973933 RepID=UPI0021627F39|nr:nucleoside triphosphate pyrophosphohydrolase [Mechercharimyces sp. CAU 1602]MCS1352385.1 nucleoside triphosphate pyrophosphohydrolase [Mechercharimyces sp. CAU 1602]